VTRSDTLSEINRNNSQFNRHQMNMKTGSCYEDYTDYFTGNKQTSPAINRRTGKRKISIEYWTPNNSDSDPDFALLTY